MTRPWVDLSTKLRNSADDPPRQRDNALSSTLRIRRATPGDIGDVLAIFHSTYEATWKPELTATAIARFESSGRTLHYVTQRIRAMCVAELRGSTVAVVDWDGDFINALHVYPQHQGHGAGSQLLAHAERSIAAAGYAQARLETDTFNRPALAFYAQHGYRETGRCPDEEWHSGFTTVKMAKYL